MQLLDAVIRNKNATVGGGLQGIPTDSDMHTFTNYYDADVTKELTGDDDHSE